MKMKRLLKSLASVFLALSSLNLHSSVSAFPKNFWKNFGDNFTLGSKPQNREIPWDDDMAFREPINILVIGEPESGKSKVAASAMVNLKNPDPSLKVNKDDIKHNRIYASLNRDDVRAVELNVDEFLNLEALDRDYLISKISWIFYVCRKGKDRSDNLLSVYNTINRVYCDKYGVKYEYHQTFPASKQSDKWFIELQQKKGGYGTFVKFIVIANAEEGDIDEEFKNEVSYFLNGREIYYVNYKDDRSIPALPGDLIELVAGRLDYGLVVPFKGNWSHDEYFSHWWSRGWRKVVSCFAQQYRSWPSEWWSYDHNEPEFLKNKLDKNQDKNNEFWERDVPSALGTGAAFGAALAALYGTGKAIQVGGKAIANKLSGNNKNKNQEISKNKLQPQNFKPTKSSENKKKTF